MSPRTIIIRKAPIESSAKSGPSIIAAGAPGGHALSGAGRPAAKTAIPAAGTLLARPRFIDRQIPPFEFLTIQFFNRMIRFRIVLHLDETKTARPARLPIHDHLGTGHLAKLFEEIVQIVLIGIPHQIANVNVLRHSARDLSVPETRLPPAVLPARGRSGRLTHMNFTPNSGVPEPEAIFFGRDHANCLLLGIHVSPDCSNGRGCSTYRTRHLVLSAPTPPSAPREAHRNPAPRPSEVANTLAFSAIFGEGTKKGRTIENVEKARIEPDEIKYLKRRDLAIRQSPEYCHNLSRL